MNPFCSRFAILAAGSLAALSLSAHVFAHSAAKNNASPIGFANAQATARGPGQAPDPSTAIGLGFDHSVALGNFISVAPPVAKTMAVGNDHCTTSGAVDSLGGQTSGSGACSGTGSGPAATK